MRRDGKKLTPTRRGFGASPRGLYVGRPLWSREAAAVHSQRNTSCFVMASPSPGGRWLFPGPPPFWRVCHTSQAQRLINLVNLRAASSPCYCSGTLPTGSGPGILQCLCFCQAVPGTAVWGCLFWLLSPQPLLIC